MRTTLSLMWLVIIALVLVVGVAYAIVRANARTSNRSPAAAWSNNGRRAASEQASVRQGAASREQLVQQFGADAPAADPAVSRSLGVTYGQPADGGLVVLSVEPGSAASRVGVVAGVAMISLNGRALTDSATAQAIVQSQPPGRPVELVWRADGEICTAEVIT